MKKSTIMGSELAQAINVVIYTRVSTDEQAQGYSLRHQLDQLEKYCKMHKFKIVKHFVDDHSAKTFERPEFKKLLEYTKANHKSVDKILIVKWDRFSRNATDALNMIRTFKKVGIEVNAVEQPIDWNVPEQKMMLHIYLAAPEIENDRRAMNTMAGMRKAMKEGRWMGGAPVGYQLERSTTGKSHLVKSEKARLVKRAFELFATGTYSIDTLRKQMGKEGLKLSKTPFWDMLRNPAYYGKVRIKARDKHPEMIFQGMHEAIISEHLYNKVQDVLQKRKKVKAKKSRIREEFPLRGLLVCSRCGKNLTASFSTGNGGKIPYYHCVSKCGERHLTSVVHSTFLDWLEAISINQHVAELYLLVFQDVFKANESERYAEIKRVEDEIEAKEKLREGALEQLIKGAIDRLTYDDYNEKATRACMDLRARMGELKRAEKGLLEHATYSLSLLCNLTHYYNTSSVEVKQEMIGLIFPEKLIYTSKTYRTTTPNEIIDLICMKASELKRRKKRKGAKKGTFSFQVVSTGIEPVSKV